MNSLMEYLGEITASGGREPRQLPVAGKLLRAVFCFLITIPDNAVTEQDFTAQAALISKNLIANFGDSADAPFIMHAERMIIVLQEGTETAEDVRAVGMSVYAAHQPARGIGTRYIDGAKYLRSLSGAGISRAATDGLAVTAQLPPVEEWPEIDEGPLFVDFARDTFVAAVHDAVDMAAAMPTLWLFDGWAFPRFDDAGVVFAGCNTPGEARTFRQKDMRARFIRDSLRRPGLNVIEKNNL